MRRYGCINITDILQHTSGCDKLSISFPLISCQHQYIFPSLPVETGSDGKSLQSGHRQYQKLFS